MILKISLSVAQSQVKPRYTQGELDQVSPHNPPVCIQSTNELHSAFERGSGMVARGPQRTFTSSRP